MDAQKSKDHGYSRRFDNFFDSITKLFVPLMRTRWIDFLLEVADFLDVRRGEPEPEEGLNKAVPTISREQTVGVKVERYGHKPW